MPKGTPLRIRASTTPNGEFDLLFTVSDPPEEEISSDIIENNFVSGSIVQYSLIISYTIIIYYFLTFLFRGKDNGTGEGKRQIPGNYSGRYS